MIELAERLRSGERLVGTVVTMADPALAELVGSAIDFAWIDLEHSALDISDLPGIAIGLRAAEAGALVRLPRWDTERLQPVLDAGVDGVVAPRVETSDQVEELVRRLRYPPEGTRGFGPRRAGSYGRGRPPRPLCVVQVESQRAIERIEEIAAVENVDAIVIGTADLSHDLGCRGAITDTVCVAVEAVRAAAEASAVPFGIAAGEPQLIAQLAGQTGTIGVLSVDVRLFARAIDVASDELARLLGARRALTRA